MADHDILHKIQKIQEFSRSDLASKELEKLKMQAEKEISTNKDNQHKQHGNIMHSKLSGRISKEQENEIKQRHVEKDRERDNQYLETAEKILEKEDPESYREYKRNDLESRGFKCGYDLSKYDKETADKIYVAMGTAKENAFSMGLDKGMKQFEKDKEAGLVKEPDNEKDHPDSWEDLKYMDYDDKDDPDYDYDIDDD